MTGRAKATTVGDSKAHRLDATPFRAYPEFAADEFAVNVIAPGRLFVALTPPSNALPALAAATAPILRACAGAARGVDPHAMHVTLRFLGDTEPRRVPALSAALRAAAAGSTRLALRISGAGTFPSLARPQVLWLGIAPDRELDKLFDRADAACDGAGFGRDRRRHHPHVTIARIRRGARPDTAALRTALRAIELPAPFVVETLDLIASTLTRTGAQHRVLERFPLG